MKRNKTIIALLLAISVVMLVVTPFFPTEGKLAMDTSESNSNPYSNFYENSQTFLKATRADNDMGTGGDAYDAYSASSSATTISQSASGTGHIDISGDQYDQYKVSISSGNTFTISFTAPTGATGLDVPIYDTDKSLAVIKYNVGSFTEAVTASGNGYIYFTVDADSSSDVGTYSISISVSGGADDDMGTGGDAYDYYGASDSATTISQSASGTGHIDISDDQYDQYKVSISSGNTFTISFTAPSGSTGIDVPIYDTDKSAIVTKYNVGSFTETVTASGNGYIYFTVDADSSSDVGTYSISISVSSGGDNDMGTGGDAYDYYGASDSATTIGQSASGTGHIDISGDQYDQYKVSINSGESLTISFTAPSGATGLDVPIYNTDKTTIVTKSNVGSFTETVTASGNGYIYFTIDADSSTDVGTYSLSVSVSAGGWGTGGKYAIIVGISDYWSISDLSYCDEDATDWYYQLNSLGYECHIYGDDHASNYPVYTSQATEANVRAAVQELAAHAQNGDQVAFITSGHGDGNGAGSSYLCMLDCSGSTGCYYDTELASDVGQFASGVDIFVFIDHCYSGGMGPELMALSNSQYIYCTTTCTEDGYGYDYSAQQNGRWTYFFLDFAWQTHYNNYAHQSMESVFDYAHDNYGIGGGDEPQEFDGNTSSSFYMD